MIDRIKEVERQREEVKNFLKDLRRRRDTAEGRDPENKKNFELSIKVHEGQLKNLTRELARLNKALQEE